ncbi:MAG: hypothetical protein QY321_04075 [Patescibacteria group bacterium]|nr:MAG: hypothetical protein QY321_04075 [Patescibacteria group bacterium]
MGIRSVISRRDRCLPWKSQAVIFCVALGYRDTGGTFNNLSSNANLWLAPQSSSTNAWRRNLNTTYSTVNRDTNNKANGFTVRCLKDWSADMGFCVGVLNL